MKAQETDTHLTYILAVAIMVLLTLFVVTCVVIKQIKLNILETIVVVVPILNALIMILAVPRKTLRGIFK